jgi:drug/metabolite transporter (DMT)-like permease
LWITPWPHTFKNIDMQKTIGILLIVAGLAMLIWTGFSYTKRENVVDVGPVHISADQQKTVTWPPYAGGILVVVGVVVLVAGRGRK